MIKKKLVLLMLGFCAVFLVGCEKTMDLTDDETQLIAEYAAELLLKYDINYVDRIDEGNEKAEELASEELEKIMNGETTTEVATSEAANTEEAVAETTTESASTATEGDVPDEEKTVGTETNIAVIAGIEGADITFSDYSIVDKYPTTDEQGEYIYLEASEGYQLLVLQFEVVNRTEEVLPVSLLDKNLDYRIVCNGSQAAKPMLTILMDDLGTLETNVEPESSQKAVLVFQVSDGMQEQLETMDLYVTYNEMDNLIKILQ